MEGLELCTFFFKKVSYEFNYLSVCLFIYLYIYIYICNMFASRAKTKQNFKNLKTQNTLLFNAECS
jgi:hypothetical protein